MHKIKWLLFTWTLLTTLAVGCQPLIIPVTPTAGATTVPPTPSANVAEAEASTVPMLTVIVASLRIRSGPGTEYTVLGAAVQGERYPILGQAYGCQWYQVAHSQFAEAWMSGGAQYVASDASCDQIGEAIVPTPPTLAPTPPAAPDATPAPVQEQQGSNLAPLPTEPPAAQPADDPFPADQGCLLLQNQLGPPLTFTFTRADGSWSDTLEVTSAADVPYCLVPGRYRVTVDAPPPWSSLNRDFQISAGERAYFPIRPQ